jgi:PKD repeat protein
MIVSFLKDKNVGYSNITTFKFTPVISPSYTNVKRVYWQFGDGTTSKIYSPSHLYKTPGTYEVTLTVYSSEGEIVSYSSTVVVKLFLSESIYFHFIPPPVYAGHINRYPFRLHISSANTKEHYIDLGVQFSKSYQPLDVPNKWSFLRPQWNFYDLDGNPVQRLKTIDTIIKANSAGELDSNGSIVVGVTGYADFYFTDDIYNFDLAFEGAPYTTIIATLDTSEAQDFSVKSGSSYLPSFANSLAQVAIPYVSLWRTPDYLKITENGSSLHSNPRWSTADIPLIINAGYYEHTVKEDYVDGNNVKLLSYNSFSHNFPLTSTQTVQISTGLVSVSTVYFQGVSAYNEFDELTSVYYPPDLLIGLSSLSAVFAPTPEIVYLDSNHLKVPGYYKGTFNIPDINTFGYHVTAALAVPVPPLSGNYYNPYLWISNPAMGQVANVQYFYQSNLSAAFGKNLNNTHIYSFDVPIVTTGLSGFHGIYSIAAGQAPSYHTWLLDTDLQFLYKVSTHGQILCAVDINQLCINNEMPYLIEDRVSPATMAVDSKNDLWITLIDSHYTIKVSNQGSFMLAVNPLIDSISPILTGLPIPSNLSLSAFLSSVYDQESRFPSNSLEDDVNLFVPTCVDTDIHDNAYITYSNPYSAMIAKYDQYGTLLYTISQNNLIGSPQEILCDNNDNFWVSLIGDNDREASDYIQKKNQYGTTLASYGPFKYINHLAIDPEQNLWFTYDYNKVGKITNEILEVETLTLTSQDFLTNSESTALDGLACDIKGKVYVINSIENRIYVINSKTNILENSFVINPQGFVFELQNDKLLTFYNKYNKSAQAQGDWTGFRWLNKYGNIALPNFNDTSRTAQITGISRKLDFYVDNSAAYNLFKINENFNLSKYFKSLAFIPALAESSFLFDTFLNNIFNFDENSALEWGTRLYENISNFVLNHTDIDLCNIDQMYDLSEMVDIPNKDYQLFYPDSIKRLMDLASINPSRLRGSKETGGQSFYSTNNNNGGYNRGSKISSSYTVVAGTPLILQDLSLKSSYKLVYTGRINKNRRYTLDTLVQFLKLKQPWQNYYSFFEYVPSSDDKQIEGVIDWNNPLTTISYPVSAFKVWLDHEGTLETMLIYELYKGLKLLK